MIKRKYKNTKNKKKKKKQIVLTTHNNKLRAYSFGHRDIPLKLIKT